MGLTTLPASLSRLTGQCGTLNISQPYRPPRPVTGIAWIFFLSNVYSECCFLTNFRLFCIDNTRAIYRRISYFSASVFCLSLYIFTKIFSHTCILLLDLFSLENASFLSIECEDSVWNGALTSPYLFLPVHQPQISCHVYRHYQSCSIWRTIGNQWLLCALRSSDFEPRSSHSELISIPRLEFMIRSLRQVLLE
jgi:hypothetical protein